jgi:ribosomal protein S27E
MDKQRTVAPAISPVVLSARGTADSVVVAELAAAERVALRRAAERRCRVYCLACGRATEQASAPLRQGRCTVCGGTLLTEPLFGLS